MDLPNTRLSLIYSFFEEVSKQENRTSLCYLSPNLVFNVIGAQPKIMKNHGLTLFATLNIKKKKKKEKQILKKLKENENTVVWVLTSKIFLGFFTRILHKKLGRCGSY